jgi:hypothetical protein
MQATKRVKLVFGVWQVAHYDIQLMFYVSNYQLMYQNIN